MSVGIDTMDNLLPDTIVTVVIQRGRSKKVYSYCGTTVSAIKVRRGMVWYKTLARAFLGCFILFHPDVQVTQVT